jgi:hypothetical protein
MLHSKRCQEGREREAMAVGNKAAVPWMRQFLHEVWESLDGKD